jgi:hypothetical protein
VASFSFCAARESSSSIDDECPLKAWNNLLLGFSEITAVVSALATTTGRNRLPESTAGELVTHTFKDATLVADLRAFSEEGTSIVDHPFVGELELGLLF